ARATMYEIEIVGIRIHQESIVVDTRLQHAHHDVVVEQKGLSREQRARPVLWQLPGPVMAAEQSALAGGFGEGEAFSHASVSVFVGSIAVIQHGVGTVEPLTREALFVEQLTVGVPVASVGLSGHTSPHDAA